MKAKTIIFAAVISGLLLAGVVGRFHCARNAQHGTSGTGVDWEHFARKWKSATIQEKKQMIDVVDIHGHLRSKSEHAVIAIFGTPSSRGSNVFDEYEIRYDFDSVPQTGGEIMRRLVFILEEDKVVRVESNVLSE